MSKVSKYIVFSGVKEDFLTHDFVAVIFPEAMSHKLVARAFLGAKVESAGFCRPVDMAVNPRPDGSTKEMDDNGTIHSVRWICWGGSVGLKVKSNPERDQKLLDRDFR